MATRAPTRTSRRSSESWRAGRASRVPRRRSGMKAAAAALVLCLSMQAVRAQPTVTPLPLQAEALSADGQVVVGAGYGDPYAQPAYWSRATGLVPLGDPPGMIA